ncbi:MULTISPECIES: helix-turn-helix transcriptional regulator [Nocardioides]|uniref:LuxR C-terminal-related transcriptional regulator n=1 Tax=Nocardioides vastitatis TaxID=2568655 RepID=A0ABW0ZE50_9ACTN|nr:LuxR C-terminal-related transcriptional regulator [Nocardioides sp.]THJ02368.1 hypothetical protein E7Z54_10560 [Nocardioides sp.]
MPRPVLARRLGRLAALTIVEALPGLGSTSLMASWAREERARGRDVVWLRTSSADSDGDAVLDRLGARLVAAGVIRTAPAGDDESGRRSWLDRLAQVSTPVIVVLDDSARVTTEETAAALVEMVRSAHAIHLVVRCESAAHFHDAAVGHNVETNTLRGTDLCVRADELPSFAAGWGHEIDAATAVRLHQLVGGWLHPTRLVLDASPPGARTLATYAAHEFLQERVLRDLVGLDQLDTAMRLAIPAELDPDLAEALAPDGAAAVNLLQRQGLLWRVPEDDGLARWRFPTLLRRSLRMELERRDPQVAAAGHGVVARALVARDPGRHMAAAVEHGRLAEDWRLLTNAWLEHGWLLLASDPDAFERAYAMPKPPADRSLAVAAGLAHGLSLIPAEADWALRSETLMRHYAQVGSEFLAADEPRVEQRISPTAQVDLLTAAMVSRRTEGRIEEALALTGALEDATHRRRASDVHLPASQSAWSRVQAATTYLMATRFGDAYRLATAAHEAAPKTVLGAGAAGMLAALHAGGGDRLEAQRWLTAYDAVDLTESWAGPLAGLPARTAKAMLAMDRLDGVTAHAELADAPLTGDALGMWPFVISAHTRYALLFGEPVTMLARVDHLATVLSRHLRDPTAVGRRVFDRSSADLMLAVGEVDRARAFLERRRDLPSWLYPPAARFHLITGDRQQAARLARAGAWRDDVHARDRMELLAISALALHAEGKHSMAHEDFRHAHALGCHTGSLEPYLLMDPETRRELMAATGLSLDPEADRLLAMSQPVYPRSAAVTRLTPRELVVLREMAHQETAAGVARALSVSVNTVKKQMISVYAKLGVHDRASALMRARRLGLLDTGACTVE